MASETVDPIDWSHPHPTRFSTPWAPRIPRCNAGNKSQDLLQPVRISGRTAHPHGQYPMRASCIGYIGAAQPQSGFDLVTLQPSAYEATTLPMRPLRAYSQVYVQICWIHMYKSNCENSGYLDALRPSQFLCNTMQLYILWYFVYFIEIPV